MDTCNNFKQQKVKDIFILKDELMNDWVLLNSSNNNTALHQRVLDDCPIILGQDVMLASYTIPSESPFSNIQQKSAAFSMTQFPDFYDNDFSSHDLILPRLTDYAEIEHIQPVTEVIVEIEDDLDTLDDDFDMESLANTENDSTNYQMIKAPVLTANASSFTVPTDSPESEYEPLNMYESDGFSKDGTTSEMFPELYDDSLSGKYSNEDTLDLENCQ